AEFATSILDTAARRWGPPRPGSCGGEAGAYRMGRGGSMATATFNLPKQWEDWTNWVLGIVLCLSPWALLFDKDSIATENAVVVGFLIILAEVVTLSVFEPWEEWINVILGGWLVISPFVLAITSTAARI